MLPDRSRFSRIGQGLPELARWPTAWMSGSTMKLALVTASILLALAGRASAQPGMTSPGTTPALDAEAPPAPALGPAGERLSEGHALALSLGGTALSWGMMIGAIYLDRSEVSGLMGTAGAIGILVAPSFGHWYADAYFTRGLGLRLGGLGVILAGAVVAFMEDPPSFGHDDPQESSDPVVGPAIAIVGAGMFVAGTIDDIVTAPRRVRRRNQGPDVALAPVVTQHSAGLALGGRF